METPDSHNENNPRLDFEFEFFSRFNGPTVIGPGPYGLREFFETVGGDVRGERLSGRVPRGGGDWMLTTGGWGHLDVRSQIETHDGAFILLSYHGVMELNDAVLNAMKTGEGTEFSDQYWHITPRLETGDPRYEWVNRSVFVGKGRIYPGQGVAYRVSRVS
ncbi:MAG: DUF3237 domain-containing protein [Patulibacter sp.]